MDLFADQTVYSAVTALHLLSLGVGVIITGLAALGYRKNRSTPMLFLAVGIALVTFLQVVVQIALFRVVSTPLGVLGSDITGLIGLLCILYAIVLARRTEPSSRVSTESRQ